MSATTRDQYVPQAMRLALTAYDNTITDALDQHAAGHLDYPAARDLCLCALMDVCGELERLEAFLGAGSDQ